MKQTIIAATAAALLASATFGIAATSSPGTGERARPSPEQMAENAAAMTDARIAALKAGLHLNADQEKLWPAVESAMRDIAKERMALRTEWREKRAQREQGGPRPDIIARMRTRADDMLARGDVLKKFVDAADPLYASLDQGQKWRFNVLLREAQRNRFAEWHRGGGRDGWRDHGPGRPHRHDGHDGPGRGGPMPGNSGPDEQL